MKKTKIIESNENQGSDSKQFSGDRRKLTKAGLIAPVLMSLSSRPAWAVTCSLSGMLSGNISGPFEQCASALSAAYWNDNRDQWPSGRSNLVVNDFFGLREVDTDVGFYLASVTFVDIYDAVFESSGIDLVNRVSNQKEHCEGKSDFESALLSLVVQAIAAVLNRDYFSSFDYDIDGSGGIIDLVHNAYITDGSGSCSFGNISSLITDFEFANNKNPYP